MELSFETFSNTAIYGFLGIGILLFATFRILHKMLVLIPGSRNRRQRIKTLMPIIEIITWAMFLIWQMNHFWKVNQLYAIALFIVLFTMVLWVVWFALRDFIAGAIFRMTKGFTLNETISVKGYSGRIAQFGTRNMVLETEHDETIYIPYSQLSGEVITRAHPAERIISHTFTLHIISTLPIDTLMDNIKNDIINLPWSSIKKTPQIRVTSREHNNIALEVVVYSINRQFIHRMEYQIRAQYEKNEVADKL